MQEKEQDGKTERSTLRDTVESVWVAIILAFVLRAFMVEAFVIPTGSMAPRLMGMHWALRCPSCGYEYRFGSDVEENAIDANSVPTNAFCPSCGFQYAGQSAKPLKVTGGDRVLVLKYVYNFNEPQPYDVVVFKNPQNNRENYIKRLIGLPGETIKVVHGDVFVSTKGQEGPWKIRRKPPVAQEAMWQVVNDGDYLPDSGMMAQKGLNSFPRWSIRQGDRGMRAVADGRMFEYEGKSSAKLEFRTSAEAFLPENAYNSRSELKYSRGFDWRLSGDQERNLCGDLKMACVFTPKSAESRIRMHLTSMGCQFVAELSADGAVSIECENSSELSGKWQVSSSYPPLQAGRGYRIEFCHADMRVWLSIDGKEAATTLDEYGNRPDEDSRITKFLRLMPEPPALAVSVDGGPSVISHLSVMRDVYYTDSEVECQEIGAYAQLTQRLGRPNNWIQSLHGGYAGWGTAENPITLRKYSDNPDLDEFYVLGDNSPKSKDCRSWTAAAPTLRLFKDGDKNQPLYQLGTVPRYNMLGRAIFVYWPAGFRIPILNWPIIPNAGKMRLIR